MFIFEGNGSSLGSLPKSAVVIDTVGYSHLNEIMRLCLMRKLGESCIESILIKLNTK